MPLGDSLTWGWDGGTDTATIDTGGYRSPLYTDLTTAAINPVNVTYVGTGTGNASPTLLAAIPPQIYQNGFNGYRIDDLENNLAGNVPGSDGVSNNGGYWLTGGGGTLRGPETAQFILLQIGTNDLEQCFDPLYTGATGSETSAQLATDTTLRLKTLINLIRAYEPNAILLVDGAPPLLNNAFDGAASQAYAADVANLIATSFQGTNVYYVDMWDAIYYNPQTPGYLFYQDDGIHLNSLGYAEMATTWAAAIQQHDKVGYAGWAAVNQLTGNNALQTAVLQPDNLNNLYKYAFGLNPATNYNPGASGLPYVGSQKVSGTDYLSLTFNGVAKDVTYTVQATSNLAGSWTTIETFPSGGTAPGMQTVYDTQAIGASSQRFMRLTLSIP
jgi:lysophospholipase L1-like esterase